MMSNARKRAFFELSILQFLTFLFDLCNIKTLTKAIFMSTSVMQRICRRYIETCFFITERLNKGALLSSKHHDTALERL